MTELSIKDIEKVVNGAFDKQAILINNAFQDQKDHFDKQTTGLDKGLDGLNKKIDDVKDELKTDIQRIEIKVDKALHTEYFNLEVRVKRLERHTGLKTA